ncbi:CHAT domain-containing protein, partial [Streptomyces anulatus]
MNRDAVFGDEADAELRALLRTADMRTDLEARHAAGWLCAVRATADPGGHGRLLGSMAGTLLLPVWVADPRLVPPLLAAVFAGIDRAVHPDPASADGPAEWAAECAAFVLAAEGQQDSPPPDASEDVLRLYESAARYATMAPSRDVQLATAIGCGTLAVLATPDDDPEFATRLEGLTYAVALAGMIWPFGDLGDARVRLGHRVLKSIPPDSPDRLLALSDLGVQLMERSWQSHDLEDLHEAVGIARDVLAQLPPESPHLSHCLSALGTALMGLLEHEGSTPQGCDEVVELFRRAAPDDPRGPAAAGL